MNSERMLKNMTRTVYELDQGLDFLMKSDGGRSFLDLQGVVQNQFVNAGIKSEQIIDLGECTCCQPEKYHSYRREGKKAGRMIAVMGWV